MTSVDRINFVTVATIKLSTRDSCPVDSVAIRTQHRPDASEKNRHYAPERDLIAAHADRIGQQAAKNGHPPTATSEHSDVALSALSGHSSADEEH